MTDSKFPIQDPGFQRRAEPAEMVGARKLLRLVGIESNCRLRIADSAAKKKGASVIRVGPVVFKVLNRGTAG
jgi:hypothetical protein